MGTKSVKFKNIKLGTLIPNGDLFYRAKYISHFYEKEDKDKEDLRVRITAHYVKGYNEGGCNPSRYELIQKWEGPAEETLFVDDGEKDDDEEDDGESEEFARA